MRFCVFLLVCLASAAWGSEEWDEVRGEVRGPRPEVGVDEFPVHPYGNQDPEASRLLFHPFALVGTGLDHSRQYADDGDGTDTTGRFLAGAELTWKPTPDLELRMGGSAGRIRHSRFRDRDESQWGFRGSGSYLGPWWLTGIGLAWSQARDPGDVVNDRVLRRDANAAVRWERLGPGFAPVLIWAMHDIDYREPTRIFDEEEDDRLRAGGELRLGWRRRSGLVPAVFLGGDVVRFDTNRRYHDARLVHAGVGITFLADNTESEWEGTIDGGVQWRRADGDFADDPDYADRIALAPYLSCKVVWKFEPISALQIRADSTFLDGRTANAEWWTRLDATLRWRLLRDRWILITPGFQRFEDTGADAGADPVVRRLYGLELGYAQQIWRGLGLRLAAGGVRQYAGVEIRPWVANARIELVGVY